MSFLKKISKKFLLSALLIFLSGLISVYDNVMNVVFYSELPVMEQNPYASWLIGKTGVSGLIEIKAIGTIVSVILMFALTKTKYRGVIIPVFIFQIMLFCYLSFYTNDYNTIGESDLFVPVKLFFEFYQGKHMP